jgi:hypothetical protein
MFSRKNKAAMEIRNKIRVFEKNVKIRECLPSKSKAQISKTPVPPKKDKGGIKNELEAGHCGFCL